MKYLLAIIVCPTGVAHTLLAAEALKQTAMMLGVSTVVGQGSVPSRTSLTDADIANADAVLLVADVLVDRSSFGNKPIYHASMAEAIRDTRAVIEAALALAPHAAPAVKTVPEPMTAPAISKRLVGITACPTGIAHTFMAAKALEKAAKALGHVIRIETQGSVGAKTPLTAEDIAAADAVVIAADTRVDLSRFAGKSIYSIDTKAALHDARSVIQSALALPADVIAPSLTATVEKAKADRAKSRTGDYKHLMTGVSHMLPVVIAGGLSIALAFALGGIHASEATGTVAWALDQIGGATAFHLIVAVLSAFIAYSIADRPGLAPGLIGGLLAQNLGAGFLGGIVSGFLAGYITKFLADHIKLPVNLEGLKPVLILPFLCTVIVGLLMIYLVAPPARGLNHAMTDWLNGLRGTNAFLLGAALGGMMAFDMGGPVNKAAYTFAVGLLASHIYTPMAAVMAGGMTPALGLGLAAILLKRRFDYEEREAAGPALVLGAAFITEGAIPFAAKDPLRVIPALVLGSSIAGAISMVCGVQLLVPHGGIFAVLIPGAVTNLLSYLAAIVTGTLATAAALFVLKSARRHQGLTT